MSLFSLDDVFGYQDANDNRTMQYGTTAPSSPGVGELWMDTSSSVFVIKRYNGSTWDDMTPIMDATGNVGIGRTPTTYKLEVEGTVQTNSIKFPATQSPSTDVNTLDDYEEGTWTPTLKFGGSSVGITYVTQYGWYVKVGRLVTISCFIGLSNKGTSVGIAQVTNLPFTATAGAVGYTPVALYFSDINFADFPVAFVEGGTTNIHLYEAKSVGGTSLNLFQSNFANNSSIMINTTYIV
ncbi:MAG: hypothetical protein B6I31_00100 [Desulfobacteraceae bacterium 4572_19]|nr:MAG: hypothetical protein B6I31_00100 [Desulfobacteraceae bacterium 4572_19]